MNILKNLKHLVFSNFEMDFNIIVDDFLNTSEKVELISKKYFLIIKHFIYPFKLNKSHVRIFGNKLYYESRWGLAFYEAALSRRKILSDNIKGDVKTVIDVGGNIGIYTLLVKRLYPNSKVFTFEPIPLVYDCLRKNTSFLKNVNLNNFALGESNSFLDMEFDQDQSGLSKFSDLPSKDLENNSLVKVEVKRLTDFCNDNNLKKIDLLKIDVESAEKFVLLGGKDILKSVRYLHIEVTIEDNKNYTFSELISLLYSKDYNFQLVYYRSFNDKFYGKPYVFDFIFENTSLL